MNPDLEAAEAVYVLSCREVVCGWVKSALCVSLIPRWCLLLPAAGFHLLSGVLQNLSWWGPELVMVGLVKKGRKGLL